MHQRDNKGLRYFEYLVSKLEEFPGMILGVGTVLDSIMTERYIHPAPTSSPLRFCGPTWAKCATATTCCGCPGAPPFRKSKSKSAGRLRYQRAAGQCARPEFVAPLARKHPDLRFIPSGISDLRDTELVKWFEAGLLAVKLSAQLFTKDLIAEKNWKAIEHNLVALLKTIHKIQATVKPVNIDPVSP